MIFRANYQGISGDGTPDFAERYDKAVLRIEDLKAALEIAKDAVLTDTARREKERRFYEAICPLTPENITFSDALFATTIERIDISSMAGDEYTLEYHFKNDDKLKLTKTTK